MERSSMPRVVSLLVAACAAALPGVHARDVVINEIHYEPDDKTVAEEFIELYNGGRGPADLSGWFFSEGISYTFAPGTTIAPGEFLLVAQDPEVLRESLGVEGALGPWDGRLENDGERVVLRNAGGGIADEVDYGVGFPWPLASAGRGSSMELIHPALDNDLGGSWRASGFVSGLPEERRYFLEGQADGWLYRKGTSEPPADWREPGFEPDGSWLSGATSIGFGDDDDATVVDDMEDVYTTLYLRRQFAIGGELPRSVMLGVFVDDGAAVWINGIEVLRLRVPDGEIPFDATAVRAAEAKWEDFLLDNPARFLRRGINVIAIHALNARITSNDFSIDAAVFVPSRTDLGEGGAPPTPGFPNTVFSEDAAPQVRQVDHAPPQPTTADPIVVTAKVTDPDGVAAVTLRYQVVLPGRYLPAYVPLAHPQLLAVRPDQPRDPNPEFEAPENWADEPMHDDGLGDDAVAGDGVYTATLEPRGNRTLVRYRIAAIDAAGTSGVVPHRDDRSLNFACFVYDGVPPYETTRLSVHPDGVGHVYSPEVLESLPVYILVTRPEDLDHCIAFNGSFQIPKANERARDRFNWEGTFVYDGRVYDHVFYRLRQANDRYGGSGKRSMRIRFHKGNYLRARDQYGRLYPTRWRTLNTGKMFDNKRVGNFGLTETMNAILWNMVDVPAPWFHTYHFRVIDGDDESPEGALGQYLGDFWGMFNAIEDYDPRFLDAHDMEDGNLYKLKDGIFNGNDLRRNQGRFAVTTDADFQNIRANLRPQRPAEWLDAHVNYDKWYPYHAVVEAIRHYDFRPADSHSKNRAWYFEPDYSGSEYGRLWTLPWDSDASWGPNWNDGIDYSKDAIFSGRKDEFKQKYRNFIREFRDLLWTEEVIPQMIDDLAAFVLEFSKADRDRWRNAPPQAGTQDFGSIEAKIDDMKRFAFVGWSGSTGPTVPAGGRARHLDVLAAAEGDAQRIPETPEITSTSAEGFPRDALSFRTSPFRDPQGDDTFGGIKWRVGEVSEPDAPFDPALPRVYEWPAVWEAEFDTFVEEVAVPAWSIEVGRRYRARVKMRDDENRWSHWSAPVEFVAGPPLGPSPHEVHLRASEVMYNPLGDEEHEFIELVNTGPDALDLTNVRFVDGVEFDFASGAITELGPGERLVVVENRRVFELRYGARDIPIAGEYSGRLDNGGEWVRLALGRTVTIHEFRYDDAWYPITDGRGRSLVAADLDAAPDAWSLPGGWRPSGFMHGSPGADDDASPENLQLPGDADQSGSLAIGDPVLVLRKLFLGATAPLPCGDGGLEDPGNRMLLDTNGDLRVDLADSIALLHHLFLGGAPPALGKACVPMPGCPEGCRG